MKRFNEFVKRLSLTQQLFALIFFFVTFFAVFFFVYINGNVTTVIREQMYGTLDSTLQSWAMSDSINDEQRQLINSAAGIDILWCGWIRRWMVPRMLRWQVKTPRIWI